MRRRRPIRRQPSRTGASAFNCKCVAISRPASRPTHFRSRRAVRGRQCVLGTDQARRRTPRCHWRSASLLCCVSFPGKSLYRPPLLRESSQASHQRLRLRWRRNSSSARTRPKPTSCEAPYRQCLIVVAIIEIALDPHYRLNHTLPHRIDAYAGASSPGDSKIGRFHFRIVAQSDASPDVRMQPFSVT